MYNVTIDLPFDDMYSNEQRFASVKNTLENTYTRGLLDDKGNITRWSGEEFRYDKRLGYVSMRNGLDDIDHLTQLGSNAVDETKTGLAKYLKNNLN